MSDEPMEPKPALDVETLMEYVRQEAQRRKSLSQTGVVNNSGEARETSLFDITISAATERAEERGVLPIPLRFFPLTVPLVRRLVLKLYATVTSERRTADAALASAVRELAQQNERLRQRLLHLENAIDKYTRRPPRD